VTDEAFAVSPDLPSLRLFIALWPDPATRAAIARWQDTWAWPPRSAPMKAERLHLTLHFLGDVPAHRLPELTAGLRAPFEPFTLALGHGEVWPNGVAVLEPAHAPRELECLHAALREAVTALGLPVDSRPFRPHVTLSRRARGATPPARQPRLGWLVEDGYVLVRSLPGGTGYQVLERFGR
jgi:2'-5' RNA ligase